MTTATKRYNKASKAEKEQARKEKLDKAQELLKTGLNNLKTSDGFKKFLKFCGKFHRYSFLNNLLLKVQAETRGQYVTRFANFNRWKELKRTVKKGEKAYYVYAPIFRPVKLKDNEDEEARVVWSAFLYYLTPVFAKEQTDGEEIEGDAWKLDGNGDIYKNAIDALIKIAPVAVEFLDQWDGGTAKGYYYQRKDDKTSATLEGIKIYNGLSDADKLSCLVHELTHAICDKNNDTDERAAMELRADSTAFCVLNALGIDTELLNLVYLNNWSGGDVEQVEKLSSDVHAVANIILTALESGEKVNRADWTKYLEKRAKEQERKDKKSPQPKAEPKAQPKPTNAGTNTAPTIAGNSLPAYSFGADFSNLNF